MRPKAEATDVASATDVADSANCAPFTGVGRHGRAADGSVAIAGDRKVFGRTVGMAQGGVV